jgi:hypothetical protein
MFWYWFESISLTLSAVRLQIFPFRGVTPRRNLTVRWPTDLFLESLPSASEPWSVGTF